MSGIDSSFCDLEEANINGSRHDFSERVWRLASRPFYYQLSEVNFGQKKRAQVLTASPPINIGTNAPNRRLVK
jgi:hypothetical protein